MRPTHGKAAVRTFETGAIRDLDDGKLDFEGFLSPLVVEAFGQYMHHHRSTAAGWRDSDNWQKGFPLDTLMKSGWRHHMEWWKEHRGHKTPEGLVWAVCGVMFNAQGYLHELIKADPTIVERALAEAGKRRSPTKGKPRKGKRK